MANTIIYPLASHYGLIRVFGEDASKFLQNQLSCDVMELTQQYMTIPGCYCTPKGRVITNFYCAYEGKESYLLRLPRDLMDITMNTLQKYIVFSKATQRDVSEDYHLMGIQGAGGGQLGEHAHKEGAIVLELGEGRYECWLPHLMDELHESWINSHPVGRVSEWRRLQILSADAEITNDTTGLFVPQALGLDKNGAVNFKKGCYPGQEVIARLHYRGEVKRQLYYGVACATRDLPLGSAIVDKNGKKCGHLLMTVPIDNKVDCLAVLTHPTDQMGIKVQGADDPIVSLDIMSTKPLVAAAIVGEGTV